MIDFEGINKTAANLLKKHGLFSIPVNLTEFAKINGIKVIEADVDVNLSGALIREATPQILINKGHPSTRKRFTLAHELGHFFLHQKTDHFIDAAPVYFRSEVMPPTKQETEANAFAAALVMPEELVHEAIKEAEELTTENINLIAEKFGVSTQSMNYRLVHLGYLVEAV